MKRILTMQDFSCVGKCSLTVALPILSAFGVETCALPTAVLSNHTAFEKFTFENLSPAVDDIIKAWKDQGFKFDGVYTGYLGAPKIIEQAKTIIDNFCDDGLILVDPAMGDNGKLYPIFDMDYARWNASLCAKADIVTPNVTEAAFMLGEEYKSEYDVSYLDKLCGKLQETGAKSVVITGVRKDDKVGVYCKDGDRRFEYFTKREVRDLHGTGDIYSSALYGALIVGKSLEESATFACDFTKHTIAQTLASATPRFYGAEFEACIGDITDFIKK